MCTENSCPKKPFKATCPVCTCRTDFLLASNGVILYLNVRADRTLHRVANIIYEKRVAVIPAAHIELLHRSKIIMPKWFCCKKIANLIVTGDAEATLNRIEKERLGEE